MGNVQELPIGDNDHRNRVLWVITELYYPEETSTGYYMTKIAEGLVNDFEVKVLSAQPNYSLRGTRAPSREDHKSVRIFRVGGTRLDKNVLWFRLTNMATQGVLFAIKSIAAIKRGDRVLVVTTPPSLPFIAAFASLVKGASYTLLVHDNYPELLMAVGKLRPKSFFARAIVFCNRWLYKYATRIIVVGRDMAESMKKKAAGLDVPVVNIPNWAELENVRPSPRASNRLLNELGLSDKFVFLYAGNMGHPNDLETILAGADMLRDRRDIHFICLGSGVKKRWLEEVVRVKSLENVTILPPRPRSEQNEFLNACDVAIVSLVPDMKGVSMPSRTYNILAAGKPILALTEKGSELALVIDENGVGWRINPGDSQSFVRAVEQAMNSRDALGEMGERARSAAVDQYSEETAIQAYRSVLS